MSIHCHKLSEAKGQSCQPPQKYLYISSIPSEGTKCWYFSITVENTSRSYKDTGKRRSEMAEMSDFWGTALLHFWMRFQSCDTANTSECFLLQKRRGFSFTGRSVFLQPFLSFIVVPSSIHAAQTTTGTELGFTSVEVLVTIQKGFFNHMQQRGKPLVLWKER